MTTELIIRIFVAAVLGGLIGLEREYRAKEAGFRTHFLVALGSVLFMVVSQFGFHHILHTETNISLDPSRIASQVVTGIGFIGAGTIIFQKHVIRGLTTAAGLWVTSAIGLACGSGMYTISIASTVLVLLCLETLNYTTQRFGTRHISLSFTSAQREQVDKILEQLKQQKATVNAYKIRPKESPSAKFYEVSMEIVMKRDRFDNNILKLMSQFQGVTIESIE